MNTSSNCATESIFDSPSFLYNTAHILTIFTLPINFFGVYLVYSKTPPLMTNMKMVMINMQIWIMLSDFCIGTLVIPYIYFPVFAVSTFGILNKLNVGIAPQFYLLVFSIGAPSEEEEVEVKQEHVPEIIPTPFVLLKNIIELIWLSVSWTTQVTLEETKKIIEKQKDSEIRVGDVSIHPKFIIFSFSFTVVLSILAMIFKILFF
ncbi:unnamed protein product [Caenorhabditis angaria]|uniref:Uncharacterized protein n=1 Tax=Caenorhabditis angaria TaxID=860376 RepID=A0A9P1N5S3_9PELO|nr:unnamed protein product [Caenorhabditis angaria]